MLSTFSFILSINQNTKIMKPQTFSFFTGMLILSLLVNSNAISQQSANAKQGDPASEQVAKGPGDINYSYKLFVAPNKVYGYDIFKNGKLIFHQPALAEPAGDKEASLTKRLQADRAAILAIEKIKKGKPAELTRKEIMQITGH
jgi:Domain of unknown function (DUF4907)